ncbi:hypothetical protein BGP_0977 [Beggiatoa sp. PS]|nr:hypothetical protein BGP_0977 [Beggiatoa sp. PS]
MLLCFSQKKALFLNDSDKSKDKSEHRYLEKLKRQSFHKWQAIIDALIVAILSIILLFVILEIIFLFI